MTTIVRLAVLVVIWLALWSDVTVANVASGVAVAAGVVLVAGRWPAGEVIVRPVAAVRFAMHFLYKLVESTVVVARTVLAPSDRVHTGIVAVPLRGCSDAIATLVADAISLTPGTLTIEVRRDPLTLYVHALDVRDVEAVQADVRRLELLALRAFGPADALAGLAVDDTRSWRGR